MSLSFLNNHKVIKRPSLPNFKNKNESLYTPLVGGTCFTIHTTSSAVLIALFPSLNGFQHSLFYNLRLFKCETKWVSMNLFSQILFNVALLCVEEYPHDRPHTTEINPCRLLTDETISDNGLTISTEEMISGPGFYGP